MTQSHVPTPSRWADILAFTAYWQGKRRADGRLPARADLDPLEMKPWLGHLSILEVVDGGRDFVFRLYGTDLAEAVGFDMTGKSAADYPGARSQVLVRTYRAAMAARRPLLSAFVVRFAGRIVMPAWERVVAPLASDGNTVDKLIVLAYRVGLEGDIAAYLAAAEAAEAAVAVVDDPPVEWL